MEAFQAAPTTIRADMDKLRQDSLTTATETNVDIVSSALGHVDPGDEFTVGFDTSDVYIFGKDGQTICYGSDLVAESPQQFSN